MINNKFFINSLNKFTGSYYGTSVGAIPHDIWVTIPFITKQYDNSNIYNSSSGIGLLPRNGNLSANFTLRSNTGAVVSVESRIKIVDPLLGTFYRGGSRSNGAYTATHGSCSLVLNKDATFEIQFEHNVGPSQTIYTDYRCWLTFKLN